MLKKENTVLNGNTISLRFLTLADCNQAYLNWLNDPDVNRYLETRWKVQSLESIRQFVLSYEDDPCNYLFAIIENKSKTHIGNIKLGPINVYHQFADISYFIGDKSKWGQGYGAEAIRLIEGFAFKALKLYRLQAGLYKSNIASAKVLEKAGFKLEAIFKQQLNSSHGREDHLWYAKHSQLI